MGPCVPGVGLQGSSGLVGNFQYATSWKLHRVSSGLGLLAKPARVRRDPMSVIRDYRFSEVYISSSPVIVDLSALILRLIFHLKGRCTHRLFPRLAVFFLGFE